MQFHLIFISFQRFQLFCWESCNIDIIYLLFQRGSRSSPKKGPKQSQWSQVPRCEFVPYSCVSPQHLETKGGCIAAASHSNTVNPVEHCWTMFHHVPSPRHSAGALSPGVAAALDPANVAARTAAWSVAAWWPAETAKAICRCRKQRRNGLSMKWNRD